MSGSCRGWYILETTCAMLGVAAVILAISDVSRIFQARNAVRVGVSDGLRCLYPTAEQCSASANSGTTPQLPLFNASFQASGGYDLPRTSYTLRATWWNEPILQVPKVHVSVSTARTLYQRDAYARYNIQFPVAAHAAYLVQVRELPWVELNPDPNIASQAQVLRAVFKDRATRKTLPGDPSGHKVLDLAQVRGTTTQATPQKIGEVSFSLEDAWPTARADQAAMSAFRMAYEYKGAFPCYHAAWSTSEDGPRISWPVGAKPASCRYQNDPLDLWNGDDLLVPIMLRVRGERYGTSRTAAGVVSAVLEYQKGGSVVAVPLGGRRFEATTLDSNFIIRGVGKGFDAATNYFVQCQKAGYTECESYSALPLIPRRSLVKISFYVERVAGTGAVGWAGNSIQLFYPQFMFGQEHLDCGTSPVPHTCGVSVEPVQPLVAYTDSSQELRSEIVPGSEMECLRTRPVGAFDSEGVALASFKMGMLSGTSALRATSFTAKVPQDVHECDAEQRTYACLDSGESYLKGCATQRAYSEEFLLSACGVSDFTKGRDRIEVLETKESESSATERRPGCSGESYPACAEPYVEKVSERFLGQNDVAACPGAVLRSCNTWSVPAYFDVESGAGCPDIPADLKREYRETCGNIPSQARVSLISKAEEPLSSMDPPGNRCQKFTKRPAIEVQCAIRAPYFVAQACCENNPSGCNIQQVSAAQGSAAGDMWFERGALAVARAQEAILTAYPQARFASAMGCPHSDKHCVRIEPPGPPDIDSRVKMTATMRVPLVLLGWLGLDEFSSVAYSEERVLEASLVG